MQTSTAQLHNAHKDGLHAQAALDAERAAVEAVRARKLKELEAAGVPMKYHTELATKKLVNW